jgi:hypothetical protein
MAGTEPMEEAALRGTKLPGKEEAQAGRTVFFSA